jgi:hypothetical protein
MRLILRILGTLSLLGMPAASLAPANAMEIQRSGNAPYDCIAVDGGNTANGTPVLAAPCTGGPEDRWNYIDGQFQGLGTFNGATMCLDVKGQGITAGTVVDLWPCGTQQNQQWLIYGGRIVGVQSGLCLDSSGGPKTGGGAQLVINRCSGATSQTWILRGSQLQLNGSSPYLCANVDGNKTANGTPVIDYSCNDAPNERWTYASTQFYGLGTDNGKSTCLTASGLTVGSLVTLSACVKAEVTQEWEIFNGAILGYPSANWITLAPAGLCLDSSGGPSVGGGTQFVLNKCTSAPSQNWIVR